MNKKKRKKSKLFFTYKRRSFSKERSTDIKNAVKSFDEMCSKSISALTQVKEQ